MSNADRCFACLVMAVASGTPFERMHSMMHVDRQLPIVSIPQEDVTEEISTDG